MGFWHNYAMTRHVVNATESVMTGDKNTDSTGDRASTEDTAETAVAQPQPYRPAAASEVASSPARPKELGGRKGPEPTRFGDWEKNGRCIDF